MYNHPFHEKKEGFIVRSRVSKQVQSSQRSYSHDKVLTNQTTFYSDFEKSPGEIRKVERGENFYVQKIDQEVYYNSDIYLKYEKVKKPVIKYEESMYAIKVRRSPKKIQVQQAKLTLEKNQQKKGFQFHNIHGDFDLYRYQQLYQFLRSIINSIQISQIQILKSIKQYIYYVQKYNIDNVNDLKFIPNKRGILKQSFAIEREAIIVICFVIAINRYQPLKNYCSNLLKYVLENYLLTLSLLTRQKNEYIQKSFENNNKEHLKGKGFQVIRSNNELMTSLVFKISKSDPLFYEQFCKIIENYSIHSVKSEFYSLMTFFAFYLHATKAAQKVPFLAASPGPYILESSTSQYTLVIDFTNIFIDNSISLRKQIKKQQYLIRPYSHYFINEMSKYFQIVSFSDYMPIQCNKIISKIDQKKCVKFKLYKYHIDYQSKRKQVQKIGRKLQKIILLDTIESLGTDNLFLINRWKGETNDAVLAEICPLLAMIAVKRLSALDSLRKIKQATSRNASLGLKYINYGLNLQTM